MESKSGNKSSALTKLTDKNDIIKTQIVKTDKSVNREIEKIENEERLAKIEIITNSANAIINWVNTGSKILIMREETKSYFNKIEADIIKLDKEIERESNANSHEMNKEKEKTKRLEMIVTLIHSKGVEMDQTLQEAMKIAIENITNG